MEKRLKKQVIVGTVGAAILAALGALALYCALTVDPRLVVVGLAMIAGVLTAGLSDVLGWTAQHLRFLRQIRKGLASPAVASPDQSSDAS